MKLMFFSPHCLIDSSSGAALCVSAMLAELNALGHQAIAVTGSLIDAHNDLFGQVGKTEPVTTYSVSGTSYSLPIRKLMFNGVSHHVMSFKAGATDEFRAIEEALLKKLYLDAFEQFQPDAVMTYGGFVSNAFAGQYAMGKGRKSVLFAASPTYDDPSLFIDFNRIATVSEAMRRRLEPLTALPKIVSGNFVRRADVVAKDRTPEYITLLNPILTKGVKLAAALAVECARLNRPYKFLFVEGRGKRDDVFAACPELKGLKNLDIAANIGDLRQVYGRTSVILFPSLWYETAGRVPIEANANGIPVLASNVGGIPEMLNGGGFLFDPPETMLKDFSTPPPADYLARWLDVIDLLHNDKTFAAEAQRRAKEADARYDPVRDAKRFVEFVMA